MQESAGFLASEEVLAHLAGILGELAHPADLYGRFGGTVFTVLLERGCMRDVEAWLKHFCKMVADSPFDREGTAVELSCTAGVCQVADSTMTIAELLQEAHDACHQGRLRGGGEVCLSASTKATRNNQEHALKEANRIRSALRKNRFQLVRSPIVKLDGRSCKLRDTWVRMVAEDGGLMLPGEFMPIAESHKLMTMIDRWVIVASLTYCAKRAPDLVFVQLSQNSVVDDTLGQWLQSILEKPGANASQICFQTTEANASQFLKQTIKQAKGLIKMGFRFAVDQLGTTPDTMAILQNVPMQFARIDAALMQGVARDRSVERQVAIIVNAAKERGIQTIGNRIEDATTMAASCKIGIDYAQGDFVRHDPIVLEDTDTMCVPDLQGRPCR
ncbi:MAG: GGDEF domain-containing protein [Proteobacteria bacterium]|nr:GGDEF domain-containing protein [Pseudomonadota bacterium]